MISRERWADLHGIEHLPPVFPHGDHPDYPEDMCHHCWYPYNSAAPEPPWWVWRHVVKCSCEHCSCAVDNSPAAS